MKLYVKASSSYVSDQEDIEVKKELKAKYKLDTRRQDAFIHLAVLGAQRLKEKINIKEDTQLYVTSTLGNIEILQKTQDYVIDKGDFIKPYDFINMLGNTTNYYVASSLGVKDKNLYQISDNFTFIHSVMAIYASLYNTNKEAILGAVDLVSSPEIISKRLLDVNKETELSSSSCYQLLSFDKEDAVAEIIFDAKIYTKEALNILLNSSSKNIVYSSSFTHLHISRIINKSIEQKTDILYVDSYDDKYKILELNLLTK